MGRIVQILTRLLVQMLTRLAESAITQGAAEGGTGPRGAGAMRHAVRAILGATTLMAALAFAATAQAADFTVTTTNDSGAGSLRQAIVEANGTPGADRIVFNI